MDREIIIYIIFLVIALLGRLMGKKKGQGQKPASSGQPSRRPKQPVKTFEELLQEFTSGKESSTESDVEEDWDDWEEPVRKEKEYPRRNLEKSPEPSFTFDRKEKLRSLDELVDIDNIKTRTSLTIEEDEEEEVPADETGIREMLQNPEDARKAIILSEILQRKYH